MHQKERQPETKRLVLLFDVRLVRVFLTLHGIVFMVVFHCGSILCLVFHDLNVSKRFLNPAMNTTWWKTLCGVSKDQHTAVSVQKNIEIDTQYII